ncbi:MAG: class I SAM-dependent methyltransferase [Rubrivivax sp.]
MSLPPCPVCQRAERQFVFTQRLLGRHDVGYHLCAGCGLLQTDTPHWLDEAYAQAIADTDTGLLQRNLEHARFLNWLLQAAFDPAGRFVDIAGGYGVLVRLLRDQGFDAYRSDKYCENLFAQGHEPFEGLAAEALFAFEVLEHVSDPVAFVQAEFERYRCRSLVFSTLTFSGAAPAPGWWYYSLESGQHVSFYQSRTLEQVAARLGCEYTRIHDGLHLFMAEPLAPALRRALRSRRLRGWFEAWYQARRRRPGLTWADHEAARQRLQAGAPSAR